jgi:hypothetical protein
MFLGGVMKSSVVLIAAVCAVAVAPAQMPQQASVRARAGTYALEGLGALGGCAGCGLVAVVGLGMMIAGSPLDEPSNPVLQGAGLCVVGVSAAGMPAAAGLCAAGVGSWLGGDRSTGWAIGWAYVGAVVGVGLVVLGTDVDRHASCRVATPFYVLGAAAVPVGAVVGYNLGSHPRGGLGGRLEAPSFALTNAELPSHSVEYGMKVQLAGFRF